MTTSPRDPVAVTGVGAVTPLGIGVGALWAGLLDARPTAAVLDGITLAHGPAIGCRAPADLPLPRRLAHQIDRFGRLALVAAEEALDAAGLLDGIGDPVTGRRLISGADGDRVGVLIGSGAGGAAEVEAQHRRLLDGGPGRVRPYLSIAMPLNMAAGQIAIRHGLRGPAAALASACASGADAIGHAVDVLRAGRADVVVAGGTEAALTPLMLAGFDAAGAMSRRTADPGAASRPFDVDRDGFVPGEGAGVLVLERLAHAEARGAPVLAHLVGYGASDDAHDPTRPSPGGEGAARALRLVLADADLAPGDVAHVNAHGTATPLNDVAECAALRQVLGDVPPVTAVKSTIGHLLGAAGAVEAVVAVQTLGAGTMPPTSNLDRQDPACDVPVVTRPARLGAGAVLSASFGFGGHNAVLAFTP